MVARRPVAVYLPTGVACYHYTMTNVPDDVGSLVADATSRARKAVEDIAAAEAWAKRDRGLRDAALRDLRDAGLTIPEIAKATGVNVHTVRLALR